MIEVISRFLRTVLREPLLHFAILGAGLMGVYRIVAPTAAEREIAVSDAVVRGLREDYRRRNGTAPSPQDEAALVQRYIDTEILYREALHLGLDRGDVIVRRRLIQKMELLAEHLATDTEPSDEELTNYLHRHRDDYATPARLSFIHIFVKADDEAAALGRVHALYAAVTSGTSPDSLGDPFLRGREFVSRSQTEIAAIFGDTFASSLFQLASQDWSSPLRSAYGYHLVRITDRQAAEVPSLDTVREQVTRAWLEEKREQAVKRELQRLREQYRIDVGSETETNVPRARREG